MRSSCTRTRVLGREILTLIPVLSPFLLLSSSLLLALLSIGAGSPWRSSSFTRMNFRRLCGGSGP